jgi:hypothetical protein
MANVTITQLPQAGAITGQELVPVVQNGQTVQTTTAAISASPSQTQTFITINQEATLPNSRSLSGSTGVGLVDGGAQSNIEITLNGVSGSLESSNVGLIAKTGGSVTGRQIVAGTAGVQITNGDGVSGNPSIQSYRTGWSACWFKWRWHPRAKRKHSYGSYVGWHGQSD